MSCLDNLAQQYHGLFLLLGVKHNFCQNMYFTKGRFQKKRKLENSNKALPPPPTLLEEKIKKTKNDLRAMKQILYDMGNFFDANRPSYGLSLFYFR